MNWLLENFQIVALVGFAFASWLKHRYDAKMAEREEREARHAPPQDPDEDFGPEEPWANPYETAPPYLPPSIPQAPPPLPVNDPGLRQAGEGEAAAVLKRQQEMQERLRMVKESRATTSGGAAATRARLASAKAGAKPVDPENPPSIRTSLRTPAALRRAIVMKEILGPPVSLR
jgi:type IV secretory pathway VirB10-like protein